MGAQTTRGSCGWRQGGEERRKGKPWCKRHAWRQQCMGHGALKCCRSLAEAGGSLMWALQRGGYQAHWKQLQGKVATGSTLTCGCCPCPRSGPACRSAFAGTGWWAATCVHQTAGWKATWCLMRGQLCDVHCRQELVRGQRPALHRAMGKWEICCTKNAKQCCALPAGAGWWAATCVQQARGNWSAGVVLLQSKCCA